MAAGDSLPVRFTICCLGGGAEDDGDVPAPAKTAENEKTLVCVMEAEGHNSYLFSLGPQFLGCGRLYLNH